MHAGATDQILGITSLQLGVFGGILVGLGVGYLHNRFYKIKLPEVLSFFGGTRAVPVICTIVYVSPYNDNIDEIASCITKKDNAPDNAATAFSAFAIPIETPIANINGRLSNIILPQSLPTLITPYKIVPGPMIFIR